MLYGIYLEQDEERLGELDVYIPTITAGQQDGPNLSIEVPPRPPPPPRIAKNAIF